MVNKRFYSGKTYSHATGHSCAFRQWRADSHCNLIHGYALQFELKFGGELDERNWVIDFGDLGKLKDFLKEFPKVRIIGKSDISMSLILPSSGSSTWNRKKETFDKCHKTQ